MFPLLRGYEPGAVIAWHDDRPLTAAQFCHSARALAARLPRSRFAFNLCESQPQFLLGSAAALIAGQTLILPPTRLTAVLARLRAEYADSCCLIDDSTEVAGAMIADSVVVAIDGTQRAEDWPPPSLPAHLEAAVLFTSGSTKEPQPQRKMWSDLVKGAEALLASLGLPPRGAAILGTVAPQHMFGFETTVMLPLQSGTPILDARPAYPGDLGDVLAGSAARGIEGIWLMTTPLQLRAFHRELRNVPGLQRIIASTMPLDRELAAAVERDWRVAVYEIYGCTEAGILATRRPAEVSHFTPAAGVTFTLAEDGRATAEGGHLPAPLPLADRLRWRAEGLDGGVGFELLGRDQDIVKIAGKRDSLLALTRQLLAIPGVRDGVLFLPDATAPRIAAIVAAPGLGEGDVRAELARRIDAAFMPRPLILVDALPRDVNAKLPLSALLEMVAARSHERASTSPSPSSPQVIERESSVAADHPALPGHFPGRPIVPGVLLLQMVHSMLTEAGYHVCGCPEAKFRAPVAPAVVIALRVEIEDQRTARFSARTSGGIAMTGTFICRMTAGTS